MNESRLSNLAIPSIERQFSKKNNFDTIITDILIEILQHWEQEQVLISIKSIT